MSSFHASTANNGSAESVLDDNLAVAEMGLPRRIVNMLDSLGIIWFNQLDDTDLLSIPGFGEQTERLIWRAIDRRRIAQGGRQPGEPTLDEIAERVAEIQKSWTDGTRRLRAGVIVEPIGVPVFEGETASEIDD